MELPFVKDLSKKYFTTCHKNVFSLFFKKYKALFLSKTSIDDLESIVMNSSNLVTCHGPLTQIAGSFKVNLIDIIEKKHEKWYHRHTSHINKYSKLYRENFTDLSKNDVF